MLVVVGVGFATWAESGSDDSEHRAAGEAAWEERSVQTENNGELIEGRIQLDPGEYTAQGMYVYGNAGLGIAVRSISGGPIDVYTIRDQDIQAYRNGNDVPFVSNLSKEGVDEETAIIQAANTGDYWVSFDNTPVYGTEPEGSIEAEVAVAAGGL